MANENRNRKNGFFVYMLDEEKQVLEKKAEKANMSKSEYIRNVILFGAARRATKFSTEDTREIIYELNRIGNNINQRALCKPLQLCG